MNAVTRVPLGLERDVKLLRQGETRQRQLQALRLDHRESQILDEVFHVESRVELPGEDPGSVVAE